MGEPKAFASLSSGLLARKGAARPAMRPQGFGQVGSGLEDLGWNDMGFEAPKPAVVANRDDEHDAFGEELPEPALRNPLAALTPIPSPVHDQQAEIEDRFGGYTDDAGEEEEESDETAELYEPDAEPTEAPEAEVDDRQSVTMVKPVKLAPVEVAPIVASVQAAPIVAPVAAPVRAAPVRTAPVRASRPRATPGSKGKAAFTLRLDGDRHLKLRLACAVTGRSAQQLVTDALDELLASMPELDTMAERAPKKRAS